MDKIKLKIKMFFCMAILLWLFVDCGNGAAGNGFSGLLTVRAEEKKNQNGEASAWESESKEISDTEYEDTTEHDIRIVIDPGHGGENLGGEYEDYTEKEMSIIVANAMKEELEKYEGITVYLTRTGDQDLTLEERCEYAKSVDADFLFCLHFNISEYHTLFGAECWVSAFGENYSKGYSFASVEMDMLQELGLYSRGIKTRLNSKGTDYYGIIRHATERDIPCVLIEHCHLDQENDKPFFDHDEKLKAFGRLDAAAVAKYFHLKSEELGVDYSDYQNIVVDVPSDVAEPDRSEPDVCEIEVLEQNAENGEVTVQVTAADYDSGMLYYTYSYDNGENFSALQRWPNKSSDTFCFTLQVPPHIVPGIVVNGYNGYDLYSTSNLVVLPSMDYKTAAELAAELAAKEAIESASAEVNPDREEEAAEAGDRGGDREEMPGFLRIVCVICAGLVLAMSFSMTLILSGRKKRSKRYGRYRKR
jgi:N-acetylmuramoyl-L-alanine amidase